YMATRSKRARSPEHANPRHLTKAAALAAAAAALLAASRHPARADTESNWVGGSGNWTNPLRWSDNDPFFSGYPNNGNGGRNFIAIINSGTVTLDAPITINTLNFGGGIIAGSNTLTLNQSSTWTDGKISGGVTVLANGGIDFSGAAYKRLRGNLTLGGESNWSAGDIEVSLVYFGDDE